ncbi:acyl-CoA thioesterase [Rhodopirellula sp. JC639]|uniref:acyl-CoA thioesterase n=1 Tax=Stieleria mannarensis TaxID=2755585 RepID=UPI001C726C59|nr:acyl-CoA thioesterase [Rhodopirellula sp. JC639]
MTQSIHQGASVAVQPHFDLAHTVAEDEIDAQQHVHNLRYLQWTLWAAGRHTESIGWDAKAALDRGLGWVVREHSIQYRGAALAGDQIIVRTWVHDLQRFASRRKSVICRPADQKVLAKVETRWVFVDLRQHKALAIPDLAKQNLVLCPEPPPLPWEELG